MNVWVKKRKQCPSLLQAAAPLVPFFNSLAVFCPGISAPSLLSSRRSRYFSIPLFFSTFNIPPTRATFPSIHPTIPLAYQQLCTSGRTPDDTAWKFASQDSKLQHSALSSLFRQHELRYQPQTRELATCCSLKAQDFLSSPPKRPAERQIPTTSQQPINPPHPQQEHPLASFLPSQDT
ncbi:hypothetical protein DL96DRAFT_478106 [Flagelloscypha sp. PMI_526]|nr:hypothetical protein DL96DRAFT_478106 [Flagelloscypha sp. PMI_526]